MLAGVTDCRRSQKWAAKEDGLWDLNLGAAAKEKEDHEDFGEKGEDHTAWRSEWRRPCSFGGEEGGPCGFGVLLFATQLRQQERLCREEKGRKDSCEWAMRRCHMALD